MKDYWSDQYVDSRSSYGEKRLKGQCDRLARIANLALQALEDMGKQDFLLLKHDDIRKWWTDQKLANRAAAAAEEAKQLKKQAKERALAKLTDEDKRLLGLKR